MGAGLRMGALKFLAVVALALVFVLGIGLPRDHAALWAQLPPPNPLTAPRAVPSAPAQLAPPVPPQGLPSLAVVPSPASPAPTPSFRVFNCSCFGPATPTHWMGQVTTASGYFGARQAAVGACLSYNQNRQPQPPVIPTGPTSSALAAVSGVVANQAAVVSSRSAGQQLPGNVTFFTAQQLRACSQCTCD